MQWSPEQISKTLLVRFPDRPEMRVSHETIYQALYVQGRGELRRELTRALRTGRTIRKPRRRPGSSHSSGICSTPCCGPRNSSGSDADTANCRTGDGAA
jgi:IS30 family transposase